MKHIFNMEIDKKDEKIIRVLKEHGDYTSRQIAKETSLPLTTVHHRIKKLKEKGIIKKYTIELDHKKIGKNIAAYILVSVDYKLLKRRKKSQHKLAKEIKEFPEVEKVDVIAGDIDIIVFARTRDIEEMDVFLLKKLQSLVGVDKTQTLIVLHEGD